MPAARITPFCAIALAVLVVALAMPGPGLAGTENSTGSAKLAFNVSPQGKSPALKSSDIYPSRYRRPGFDGKSLPTQEYKGFTLIGAENPDNESFFGKIKQSIDLIERNSPAIFGLMAHINPQGRRVIAYTGKPGPASFTAWKDDYVVNITATGIDEDPVFENSQYSLAATLVHELVGHGRQQNDRRVWAMYDWCGKSNGKIEGVAWTTNHQGHSSGLVEYEANLFARWFLESVRGVYPDLNEVPIRRYVKIVRAMKKRFPSWYDERKTSVDLLQEFETHFRKVCPGLRFTPHPVSQG